MNSLVVSAWGWTLIAGCSVELEKSTSDAGTPAAVIATDAGMPDDGGGRVAEPPAPPSPPSPSDAAAPTGPDPDDGGRGGAPSEPPPPPECREDEDCDDDNVCNGDERCMRGRCQPGERLICSNPDAAQCTLLCDAILGCLVEALDGDEDGFPSGACPVELEEDERDCDDSDPDVNPGEFEACNGVDDDCDGLTDLEDGIPLGGGVTPIANWPVVNLAWSPVAQVYGLTSNHADYDTVLYGTLTRSGVPNTWFPPLTGNLDGVGIGSVGIAWGDSGTFLIGYVFKDGVGVVGAEVAVSGTPLGSTTGLGNSGPSFRTAVASFAGGWLVGTTRLGDRVPILVPVNTTVELSGLEVKAGKSEVLAEHLATSTNDAAFVWQFEDEDEPVGWSRIQLMGGATDTGVEPFALVKTPAAPFPLPGTIVDVARTPPSVPGDAYALGSIDAGVVSILKVALDGSTICGPTEQAFGDEDGNADGGLALVFTERGLFALATDASANEVRLFHWNDACELADSPVVHEDANMPSQPEIASGGHTLGMTWTEHPTDGQDTAQARVVDEFLCK